MRLLTHRQHVLVGCLVCVCVMGAGPAQAAVEEQPGFAKQVNAVLEKRIDTLHTLIEDPVILQAVRDSAVQHKDITLPITLPDILRIDRKWIAKDKDVDPLIKSLTVNACANHLMVFQDAHDGYPEIFIADDKGLNVCQTNRTSDYMQSDEDWWVQGYNDGQGKTFYGKIEYDESAMSESIPVFLPVMDPDTKKAIGVMKVIVDITAIKREL